MPINVYTANRDDTWLFRATGNGPFNYTFPGSLYAPLETHDWKLYEWSGTIYGNTTRSLGGNDAIADDQVIAVNQSFTLYDVGYEYMTYYFKIYNIRYITSTITYDGNQNTGGSTGSNTATYNSPFIFQANGFTKTGYTFFRWALNVNGNFIGYYNEGQLYGIWTMTSSNVIVYAQWTAKEYTITYDANGANGGTTNSNKATYDLNFTFQNNGFTLTGHEFSGWHLYDGITRINQTSTYGPTSASYLYGKWDKDKNLTAKAQWTAKEYTITYDANGANGGTTNSNKATYDLNFTFQNNGFTLTGHEFSGWHLYDGITRINQTSTYGPTSASYLYGKWDKDKNLTAKAQWTRNVFAVTFNANGKGGPNGTGGTKIIAQNYNTIVICPIFKAVGFVFEGWATSATSTTVNKIGGATFTLGNADQTFFAIWTVNTNGIRFSELQTVFGGENPIRISEYRTESGQTIANSEIRLSANFKGKGPQP